MNLHDKFGDIFYISVEPDNIRSNGYRCNNKTNGKVFSCLEGNLLSNSSLYSIYSIRQHVSMSVVDSGIESGSDQTKDYEIGICCISAKHTVLRSKSKDWLDRKNVSE